MSTAKDRAHIVTEAEMALAAKAGFAKMGSAPIWPTTRGNLLGYIHCQRKSLKICSPRWRAEIWWSIRSAQRCLARLRVARIGGAP